MRNIENYIKGVYTHAPEAYRLSAGEINQLCNMKKCDSELVIKSWSLGFMMAYNAAKRGKLDFQQALK